MKLRSFACAAVALFLVAGGSRAQSAADLLQKGLYAQETQGDLDGAIRLYRQVVTSPGVSKSLAAQAQYQLVLCMLQKGDRNGVALESQMLERNFPNERELIDKAHKLVPGTTALLPVPWGEGESFQMNIKRDGAFTGDYLYYWVGPNMYGPRGPSETVAMKWLLVTQSSRREVTVSVDPETMQRPEVRRLASDDDRGDPAAKPLAGPLVDVDPLVFRMRRLPLGAGYKGSLTIRPLVLGFSVPRTVDFSVTATEPVQVTAGKFTCYKLQFPALSQTFWIGVDGAHPLVKFQSGNVEAELVKTWGASAFDDALQFLTAAGWTHMGQDFRMNPGPQMGSNFTAPPFSQNQGAFWLSATVIQRYTPREDLALSIQKALEERMKNAKDLAVRPESVQTIHQPGQEIFSCMVENRETHKASYYYAWIQTDAYLVELQKGDDLGLFRWMFDPVLASARIPQ